MIYFDVTEIAHFAARSSRLTGIQRVQFNVIVRLAARHGGESIRCVFHDSRIGGMGEFDPALFGSQGEFDAHGLLARLGLLPARTFFPSGAALKTYLRNNARSKWHRAWLKGGLYLRALYDRSGLLNERLLTSEPAEYRREVVRPHALAALPANAHLVHMGSSWNFPATWAFARQHRQAGGDVVQYVHDLIPLTHPEFMPAKEPPVFVRWLEQAFDYASRFPCNSQWVANDLRNYMAAQQYQGAVGVVPLAHEFLGFPPAADVAAPESLNGLQPGSFVVTVGTIEARKNGLSLLKVWERLQDQLGESLPTLVFAGRLGRIGGDEFREYLESRPRLQQKAKVIHSPSDHLMAWLYRNCLFSAYPSHVEGWGLPVGESAWFGRLCLASSASSIPEVCGEFAEYVAPDDLDDIQRGVLRLVTDHAYRQSRQAALAQLSLRTWQQVADDFYDYVTAAR